MDHSNKKIIELLSPAKDLESGIAAINCGADAVYIGAPKFGARSAAGNSLGDIKLLVDYAHKYWAKVYVTVNTIIFDNELDEVRKLINDLYDIKVDAVIFQDMSLLEMEIPPVQLFASTQTHNYELDRIKFLDDIGIQRIILARELSIEQIKEISQNTKTELEFFVHGALCVCLSGQCYMSAAMFGRSANRGECAQPCRLEYSLVDKNGKVIAKDKHLLSLRDLNLSAYLNELIEAGITSFKIEGRLKDSDYVKNITAYYRNKLDSIIESNPDLKRSSSGYSTFPFEPDPDKTFNRGYTSYFIDGKDDEMSSIDTPKSKGKYLGKVKHITKNGIEIATKEKIVNGDGLCFFGVSGKLTGMNVNKVEGNFIFTKEAKDLNEGKEIYRNYDKEFSDKLKKECIRKIKAELTVTETTDGLNIICRDEDGIVSEINEEIKKEIADNPDKSIESFKKQFMKSGDTIFDVGNVKLNFHAPVFLSLKQMNELRRKILVAAKNERVKVHIKNIPHFKKNHAEYPAKKMDYKFNVANDLSAKFYEEHGIDEFEKGFEIQNDSAGKTIMTCKYCIKDELGACPKNSDIIYNEPLYLLSGKNNYTLKFNCKDCQMEVLLPPRS